MTCKKVSAQDLRHPEVSSVFYFIFWTDLFMFVYSVCLYLVEHAELLLCSFSYVTRLLYSTKRAPGTYARGSIDFHSLDED